MRGKWLLVPLMFLLLASSAYPATIYGTVYDLSLKKSQNTRIEINTIPKQMAVASNGTYSFEVPNGRYSLRAFALSKNSVVAYVEENITVASDGNYILDLILFPDLEEGLEDASLDVEEKLIESKSYFFHVLLVLLAALLILLFFIAKKLYKTESKIEEAIEDELDAVVSIIKKEGGRTTQKEIRKQIPLSEAKISLMIAELEHKGIIEKIKKGRGNIIILKK